MPDTLSHLSTWLPAHTGSQLTPEHSRGVMVGLFWLVVASVVLGIVFWLIRRWFTREDDPGLSLGFTLDDLRQMHERGELTDEEFELARKKMLAKGRQMMADDDTSQEGPGTDGLILGLPDRADGSSADSRGETAGNDVDNADAASDAPDKTDPRPGGPDQA